MTESKAPIPSEPSQKQPKAGIPAQQGKPNRRRFLQRTLLSGLGILGAGSVYGVWEAAQIRVRRQRIALPNLPSAFAGKTIALLADFHHGPLVGIAYIQEAVRMTNALVPDIIALVGDFAHNREHTRKRMGPCLEALSQLHAPMGVFAVPGNHDMEEGGRIYREMIRTTPLTDLSNRSVYLTIGGEHLWLAGIDDLRCGVPNLRAALRGITGRNAVILLSHNPDLAEEQPDSRVGLILSGHTHGGQINFPLLGPLRLPSRYGTKYRAGLVQGPASQVFISCGLGTTALPIRMNCPPEINLLTLVSPESSIP